MLRPACLRARPAHVILGCLGFVLLGAGPAHAQDTTLSLTGQAFGQAAEVEVLHADRAEAEAAIQSAYLEFERVEALTAPTGDGGIAQLNEAAPGTPVILDGELLEILARARSFCSWSDGAHGPLGGMLYAQWGLRQPVELPPWGKELDVARESAACDLLELELAASTAILKGPARVDLHGFATGHAIDRAVDVLARAGIENARIRIGAVVRGVGPGPGGRGWPVPVELLDGVEDAVGKARLRDQALAATLVEDRRLRIGDETFASYIDQRNGKSPEGLIGVLAVAERAADAQPLSISLYLLGSRDGQFRLGGLRPNPAAVWLLGRPGQPGLQVEHHWSDFTRKR